MRQILELQFTKLVKLMYNAGLIFGFIFYEYLQNQKPKVGNLECWGLRTRSDLNRVTCIGEISEPNIFFPPTMTYHPRGKIIYGKILEFQERERERRIINQQKDKLTQPI